VIALFVAARRMSNLVERRSDAMIDDGRRRAVTEGVRPAGRRGPIPDQARRRRSTSWGMSSTTARGWLPIPLRGIRDLLVTY
jgi:hypothetical protein